MLGIVILNYKTFNDTVNCVESILKVIGNIQYTVYIVDNMSPDGSFERLSAEYGGRENIRVIPSGKNGGFSYGNNVGFRAAISDGCDKILCTNSDVEFKQNSIDIMIKDLDEIADCAVVGPKVYCGDGSVQNANKGVLNAFRFFMRRKPFSWFDWFGVEKRYSYLNYKYDAPIYIDGMVSGCCFMIRSSVLAEIGFLDERVFLYHEENILGAKLHKAGYKVRLNPQSEVIHFGGKSTGGGKSAFVRYHMMASALYYFKNYADISRFSYWAVRNFVKCMFFFKGILNKEYKQYYRKLKKLVKMMKREEEIYINEV